MDARKKIAVSHPINRFHHLKQLISFPAISEVVFLFKVCAAKDHDRPAPPQPKDAAREPVIAAGKSVGN